MQSTSKIFSVVREDDDGKLRIGKIPCHNDSSPTFVVGIYGSQKSGKSTNLNLLYGTQFETGQNLNQRTTEGINACYVKKNATFNTDDTIVLDCEGEKSQQKKQAIKDSVQQLPKLTDKEKEERAESILKISDIRYASFLWCASHCIIVILPNSPPNNDTVRFFQLIHESMDRMQKTNHRPSLILTIRTNKSRLASLSDAYSKVLNEMEGFSSLISDLKILNLPEYDESPDEPAFKNALNALKEEINSQSLKHDKFIQASWSKCLDITAFQLNTDAALEDLNFLKVQIELNFVLSQNEGKIPEIAMYLENMIRYREAIYSNFEKGLAKCYEIQINDLIEKIQNKTSDYKVGKTVKSVVLGLTTLTAVGFAPVAAASILVGFFGMTIDSRYKKTIEDFTTKFLEESKTTISKLNEIHELILDYQESFNRAKNLLSIHETLLSRVEFFYGVARGVLIKHKPEATSEDFLRYMFILFARDINAEYSEAISAGLSGGKFVDTKIASANNLGGVVITSNFGLLVRGSYKFIATESGCVLGETTKTVLRTVKYGGACLTGALEIFDVISTLRTNQSQLIDSMQEQQEKLDSFYEKLQDFWNSNTEILTQIESLVCKFELNQ